MTALLFVATLALAQAPPAPIVESLPDQVVRLTNAERRKAGLRELGTHSLLELMAEHMARDLSILGVLRHEDRHGRDLVTRANLVRYPWMAIGENVAQGQRTPREVVLAWMRSKGHRENILSPEYREIGVALVSGKKGRFWVQIFGSR